MRKDGRVNPTIHPPAHAVCYAERRVREHCDDAQSLLDALGPEAGDRLAQAQSRAEELARRDQVFPDVLPAVAAALGGSRSLAVD